MENVTIFTPKPARDYAGLTMDQVSEYLGISRFTLSKLESNPKKFTIEQAEKLSEVTKVPYNSIVF